MRERGICCCRPRVRRRWTMSANTCRIFRRRSQRCPRRCFRTAVCCGTGSGRRSGLCSPGCSFTVAVLFPQNTFIESDIDAFSRCIFSLHSMCAMRVVSCGLVVFTVAVRLCRSELIRRECNAMFLISAFAGFIFLIKVLCNKIHGMQNNLASW